MKCSGAVLVVGSCLLLAITGCSRESNAGKPKGGGERAVDVDYAFSRGKYDVAIPLLRARLDENPNDLGDWFRLGFALHTEGRLEEAIDAHARAAESSGPQKALAIYNWGCALAMLGRKEEAIVKLEEAVANGFYRKKTMLEDPELDSLRKEPRFLKIVESMVRPADSDEEASDNNELDFYVGEWELQDKDGKPVAQTTVTSEQNGHVLREVFRADRQSTSTSLLFFDPTEERWKQTVIGGSGRIVYYEGTWENNALRLEGREVARDEAPRRRRFTLTPDPNEGTISWKLERSDEDGESFEILFEGRLVARKPRLSF